MSRTTLRGHAALQSVCASRADPEPGDRMTIPRLLAIGFIYVCAALAWGVLGGSLVARTGEFDNRLSRDVALLWGGKHVQIAPQVRVERPTTVTERIQESDAQGRPVTREVSRRSVERTVLPLDATRVTVALDLDQRQKGLLWYDTYAVRFRGSWRVHNPDAVPRRVIVTFAFPSADAIYDGFVFTAGGPREAGGAGPSAGGGGLGCGPA